MEGSAIEAALRRDRLTVAATLVLMTIVAWAWTLASALRMRAGVEMGMGGNVGAMAMTVATWSPGHAALMFMMWWIMMAAMMLPSAAPLVLLATALQRRRHRYSHPGLMAALLATGYLTVWGGFSLMATVAQWGLESSGAVNPDSVTAGPTLAGGILIACGLYQFAPTKQACLRRCRSPLEFLTTWWRPTAAGAFQTGVVHGGFCVGCCWFLMGLLFVGGVMNPFWIGGLAAYVLVEKCGPYGVGFSRGFGLFLLLCGALILSRTV